MQHKPQCTNCFIASCKWVGLYSHTPKISTSWFIFQCLLSFLHVVFTVIGTKVNWIEATHTYYRIIGAARVQVLRSTSTPPWKMYTRRSARPPCYVYYRQHNLHMYIRFIHMYTCTCVCMCTREFFYDLQDPDFHQHREKNT